MTHTVVNGEGVAMGKIYALANQKDRTL